MNNYTFDDGSLESKVLQHEYKVKAIDVRSLPSYNLDRWLSEVIDNKKDEDVIKVYLPFCHSTLLRRDIDIRTDVAEALHKYPHLRIIMPYEQMDKLTIERKAQEYGIKQPIAEDVIRPGKEGVSDDFVKALENEKVRQIDFKSKAWGKYSVGGNDSLRSEPRKKGRKKE